MLPVPPSSPRVELTTRKALVASMDPWAQRVKEEAARDAIERKSSKQMQMEQREQHRAALEKQIEQRKLLQEAEKQEKTTAIQDVNASYRDFVHTREAYRADARSKNALLAKQRLEQLQLLEAHRKAEQQAAELEAQRLRDEALQRMEEEKALLRAKRRTFEETSKESLRLSEAARKQKLIARQVQVQREVSEMEAYAKVMEEQERRRQEQLARHKPRLPGKLYASADKFDDPKYQQYFASVDRAAQEKQQADEERELEKQRKAKAESIRCMAEIEAQMKRKLEVDRRRRAEEAQERAILEADADQWSKSQTQQKSKRMMEQARVARELEGQMSIAREREIIESIRGPPGTAR